MGFGPKFSDPKHPRVVVQVGQKGDTGRMELVEMLWTVKGPTKGAILMEWNVNEGSIQGQGTSDPTPLPSLGLLLIAW